VKASGNRKPSIAVPRFRRGKVFLLAAAAIALFAFLAAVARRTPMGLQAGDAGEPPISWKEATPAEIFGAGP
jgi:hypothetical protein